MLENLFPILSMMSGNLLNVQIINFVKLLLLMKNFQETVLIMLEPFKSLPLPSMENKLKYIQIRKKILLISAKEATKQT